MNKYAALISYSGTSFRGWQKQKGKHAGGTPTIQETIELALSKMTSETVTVVGSGRTDSGVHALGQVAHFVLRNKPWDCGILLRGMNSMLPESIRFLEVREVPIEFSAQRSAKKKQYSYYFQQGPTALPHMRHFTRWMSKELNLVAMNQAIGLLVGEHDYKAFQGGGAKPGPTVRKIFEAEVTREKLVFPGYGASEFGLVRVRVLGSGFLKQMVRGITGTLLQVGENRRDPSCMSEILETLDRKLVGPTAPSHGLWLERVWYADFDFTLARDAALK